MRRCFSHSLQLDEKPSFRLLLRTKNSAVHGNRRPQVRQTFLSESGVSIN